MMKLWQLIRDNKKDKKQIKYTLNDGQCGYCVNGLIINGINENIDIKDKAWIPIIDFIQDNNNDLFTFNEDYFTGNRTNEEIIKDLKEVYNETGRIDMGILMGLNDKTNGLSFDEFEALFKEMDV